MAHEGPTFFQGIVLLALAVVPAIVLDSQPWKTIAIANAATHLVTGFAWTMVGTRYSRWFKEIGILIWSLTCFVSIGLLVACIFVS